MLARGREVGETGGGWSKGTNFQSEDEEVLRIEATAR